MRLTLAVAAGRLTAWLSRALRAGGGTTMPGRVARGICPDVTRRLASRLRHGVIVVTGTNGKTTTARLIAHVLREAGRVPIHNRAGANLAAGLAAALVERSTLGGVLRGDVGVFEADEATLPRVLPDLAPRVVVLLNLFRDQLDRYGEIDLIGWRWGEALRDLRADATVVANADDPMVSAVARGLAARVVSFGIEDASCGVGVVEHAADGRYCYNCGRPYTYEVAYFGHMGRYRCEGCGAARPDPSISAHEVAILGVDGSRFVIRHPGGAFDAATVLPGVYNVHDVLAAAACCLTLGVPPDTVRDAIRSFAPAFGRAERLRVDGHEVQILLAKNPAGFNEVLRTVLRGEPGATVLVAINDLIADGRDISWLWDVDFERLRDAGRVIVSGIRADDMALRLKYAGLAEGMVEVERDLPRALAAALARADGRRLYVLPTYTAMLSLRDHLARRGLVRGFWAQ